MNPNHDEKGRFASGPGGSLMPQPKRLKGMMEQIQETQEAYSLTVPRGGRIVEEGVNYRLDAGRAVKVASKMTSTEDREGVVWDVDKATGKLVPIKMSPVRVNGR